jgi:hypothetical protein
MPKLSFLLQPNDRVERIDSFLSIVQRFLFEDATDFKIF